MTGHDGWQAYSETMTTLDYTDSIDVAVPPSKLYAMLSDVTRTGEWSPVCKECRWEDDGGPRVGAHFTGRNEEAGRTWETRSTVVAADPDREFAWVVNGGWVHWGYTLEPTDGGTRLTESWEFRPDGIAGFKERFGDDADAQIAKRSEAALNGIPATLAAIKKIAESE